MSAMMARRSPGASSRRCPRGSPQGSDLFDRGLFIASPTVQKGSGVLPEHASTPALVGQVARVELKPNTVAFFRTVPRGAA